MQPPCGALVPSHRSICPIPTQECLLGVHADVTAFLGRRDCINGSYRLAFMCVCVYVYVYVCVMKALHRHIYFRYQIFITLLCDTVKLPKIMWQSIYE